MMGKLASSLQHFFIESVKMTAYKNGLAELESRVNVIKAESEKKLKSTVITVIMVIIALPLIITGLIFLLISLFFYLADFNSLVFPAVICGAIPICVGVLLVLIRVLFK